MSDAEPSPSAGTPGTDLRLHPRSIPYRVLESLSRIVAPLAFVGVTSGAFVDLRFLPAVWLLLLGVLGAAALREVLYVSRFEIAVADGTLTIRSGVLARRDRDIPIERVHNVDVRQNVLQRALGIAAVDVETAGGSATEATLRYVDLETADRLRTLREGARDARSEATDPRDADGELYRITSRELALLGVLSWDLRVLSGISVLASVAGPTFFLGPVPVEPIPAHLAESLGVAGAVENAGVVLLAAGVLAVALLSGVVSGATAVANYWGFRLVRRGDELRYERGLLRRYEGTIPLEKVQAAAISEPVPRRWFGYASLTVATAGYGPDEDRTRIAAIPIAEVDRVWSLLETLQGVGDGVIRRPPRRSRRRYAMRYLIGVALLTAIAVGLAAVSGRPPVLGTVPLAFVPLVPVAAHAKWTSLGYRFDEGHLVTRRGWWSRDTVVVADHRVQTVIERRTPFQRRWSLASVVVDTAVGGGLGTPDPVVADIDGGEAAAVREAVADRLVDALAERGAGAAGTAPVAARRPTDGHRPGS